MTRKFKGTLEIEYIPAKKGGMFRVHDPIFSVLFHAENGNSVVVKSEECPDAKIKFDRWTQGIKGSPVT